MQDHGLKDYYIGKAKPVFMKIAEERIWPPNSNFSTYYRTGTLIDGKRFDYDGFWLRLQIHTEKSEQGHDNFAIPIISMGFGEVRF